MMANNFHFCRTQMHIVLPLWMQTWYRKMPLLSANVDTD